MTTTSDTGRVAPAHEANALPELRAVWWEGGVRARAEASIASVLAELPKLVLAAFRVSWGASRARTAVIVGATLGSGTMATFGLLATQQVLVGLFSGGPTPDRVRAALPALVALGALTAVRAALGTATGFASNGLTPLVDRSVQRHLYEATTRVRLESFDQDTFSDEMERAWRGCDSTTLVVQAAINLLAGVVSLLAVAAAVVVIHPLLLPALFLATAPSAWAALRAGHLQYQTYLAGTVRRRRLWLLNHLMAVRQPAAELRSYGLRGFLLGQYDRVMTAETAIQLRLARRVTVTTSVGAAIGGVATAAVYLLLGLLLVDGRIPLSAAATGVIAVQAAQRALSTVTFQVDRLYAEGRHFRDYTGFMERADEYLPPPAGDRAPGPFESLSLEGVTLTYPDRDTPAVDGVSLRVRAGQMVAFAGENGSGKSTLAAVVAGLRTPDAGVVRWNGVPTTDLDPELLRARIGVVSQEFYKWPFSAATNIAMGDIDHTPQQPRIEAAATKAVAHDMIVDLPHGYSTMLDRAFAQGQDLSGGQWQRVTAARGFLRDTDLLIMDEPSSALDAPAEAALFDAVRARRGVKTTVLITHRLANIRHADVIYVMHEGRLVEQGTHEDLIAAAGLYATWFRLQKLGYSDD
ncbi:ABC transporter ATP-binding protein [Phytohabitans suffuscus]